MTFHLVPAGSNNGARTDYLFDKNGNRTSLERRTAANQSTPDTVDSYTYTAGTNRLSSISAAAGSRNFSYDARGNLASESRPGNINVTAQKFRGHQLRGHQLRGHYTN